MIEHFYPDPAELQSLKAGPLSPHLDAFAALLARRRYCAGNGWQKVRLVADLSCWMARKGLQLQELSEQQAATCLEVRWRDPASERRQSNDDRTAPPVARSAGRSTSVGTDAQPG